MPPGGQIGSGGTSGSGGTTTAGTGPCDIFAAGNTPCVAAHGTVRALLGAYDGNLYQVTRTSGNTTKDIGVLSPGGFANSATQNTFCTGTTCTITIIYDQSGKNNHLTQAPIGQRNTTAPKEADATALPFTISGHKVYGVHIPVGNTAQGNFYEGVMTSGAASTATAQAVQANIAAAGYGN
jgi:hypothetical protein